MMRNVFAVVAALLVLGCSSDGMVGSSTVTGAYTLRTINGSSLPYTITESGGVQKEILSDVINLYQGLTYAENANIRVIGNNGGSATTTNESGTYGLVGNSVNLVSADRTRSRYAIIEGNEMKFVESGTTFIFRK